MEVTTLQEDLAAEQGALCVLVEKANQAHGQYVELMAQAAATRSRHSRHAILQRSIQAKQLRDALQADLSRQEERVRSIRRQIEDERLLRIGNLDLHDRLQQIATAPTTPEAA